MIDRIIHRSLESALLSAEEIAHLFQAPLFSRESALIISAAREKSEKASRGLAEVHAQVGLNVAPCPNNCLFCSFAAENRVFTHRSDLPAEKAVELAAGFQRDGANAIYLMSTADYSFAKYIEISREIRRSLRPETILVANVADFDAKQAKMLKDCGFSGIYHAVRFGEGVITRIPAERRLETFRNAKEAGLLLGTCVEPVGTEHTIKELLEKTIITRDAKPVYSGAARRIPIPETQLADRGIVSEARMAHILAVVRLALGYDVPGNCTHEPNVIGAAAGANLLWAEAGSNPRDTENSTEDQRGMTVSECIRILKEGEWKVLDGPSLFFSDKSRPGEKLTSMENEAHGGE